MIEQVNKANNWLLSGTAFAYIVYVMTALGNGTLTFATPVGTLLAFLSLNGLFLALMILLAIYITIRLSKKIRRSNDEKRKQFAKEIAKNLKEEMKNKD